LKSMVIYIDGKWVKREDAKVSVFDHGLLYGDGVFEGIRAYNGHVFRLDEHLRRLERSARLISLKIPVSRQKLASVVYAALRKNNLSDSYIRLLVTRGAGDLGLDPRACPRAGVIVIANKLALFPAECYEKGLHAIIAKRPRTPVECLDPSIKSLNYLNNILAKIEAVRAGVPEAVMLNTEGFVSECTGDNIFLVQGRTIVTPPVKAGVLVGITRQAVMEIIRNRTTYNLAERMFKPDQIFRSDEIFFTGTAAEVIPVTRINRRRIGSGRPGKVTLELMGHFRRLIETEARKGRG
jgi:branched-chain amino acid aminotransferase